MNDEHDNPMTECICCDCKRSFYKEQNDGNEKYCLRCEARSEAQSRYDSDNGCDDFED